MRSAKHCHKWGAVAVPLVMMCLSTTAANAVTLNFSALLMPGTCTFNLDKSALSLGRIGKTELKPVTLVAVQPFTLQVTACSGSSSTLTPVVTISGEGANLGGKWVFRSPETTAAQTGVMLVKASTPPDYSATAVRDGDRFDLASSGAVPVDQNHTFYAGLTCGSTSTCSGVKGGSVTARVLFKLDYR